MAATAGVADDAGGCRGGGERMKLLCSLGGHVLPRPGDGELRYVGGDTRIVSVPRGIALPDLLARLGGAYGGAAGAGFAVKYQLPNEGLDALISVSTPEDLDNMIEEYDKLLGPASKLRVFLFPLSDAGGGAASEDSSGFDGGLRYLEAVNGIVRMDSLTSLGSTQNSDGVPPPVATGGAVSPAAISPTSNDALRSAFNVAPLVDVFGSEVAVSVKPQDNADEVRATDAMRFRQPLSQLPPLMPVFVNDHREATQGLHQPQQMVGNGCRFEDCNMCLKALPHVHTDSVVKGYAGEGHVGGGPAPGPVFMSLRPEDVTRIMMQEQVVPAPVGAYGYTHVHSIPHEREVFPHKADGSVAIDPAGLHQHVFVQQQQQPHQLHSTYVLSHIPVMPHEEPVVSPSSYALSVHTDHLNAQQQVSQQQQQQQQQLPGSHGMAQHLVKQATPDNPLLGEGSLSGNARYREDMQLSHDNVTPVAPVAVPTYVANVDRMLDSLRLSPTEASVSTEHHKHAISPDICTPQNVMQEHPHRFPDNSFATRSDTGAKEVHQSNANDYVHEPKVVLLPTVPMQPPSEAGSYFHNVQHANVGHVPHMMSMGAPYPSYLVATVGPGGVSPLSYGVDLVYANSVVDQVSERKDAVPENFHKEAPHEVIAPPSANAQVSTTAANHATNVEQLQVSTFPKQQFNNDDPRKLLTNAHALPPKPKRVASRENISPKDANSNNSVLNCKGPELNIPSDDTVLHRQSGDDATKKDMLVMEDGLVAPNVQSSEPKPHLPAAHEEQGHADLLNEGAGAVTNKVDGEVHTNEVIKRRPVDWIKPSAFPVMDDLGHLQIIEDNDLEELQELGSGTFGTVYHGKWRGSDVAIKRINDRCFAGKPSEQEKMRSDFWNEASKLADLHHPNVVAFYGVALDGPGGSIATVTEYMVNGSLRQALLKNAKTLDRRKRLIIAMDAAFGMEYLHNKNIVHFDLKSDNLLVNLRDPQRPICKVGDLGLSKVKCKTLISGGVKGTLPWMAPELLNGSSSLVSEKVDVFSFGIVLWELLTGEEPYADLHYGVIIGGIVSNTLRPPVPDSCDPEWRSLMEQCWSTEPSDRPSFTEIAGRLRSMATSQKLQP